jgi:hypothetical protein
VNAAATPPNRVNLLQFPKRRTPTFEKARGQQLPRKTGMLLMQMVMWET